jgi:hypothetical protein
MPNIILFVDSEYVRQNSFMLESVDDKFLEESMFNAQKLYVEPLIGTRLYNSLGTKILDGTITSAGNVSYQTLLDSYIVPALVKMCVYETLLPLTYKITPKGIIRQSSENTEIPSLEEVQFVMGQARDRGEKFLEMLRRYILDSDVRTGLPELNQSVNGLTELPSIPTNQYQTGVFLRSRYQLAYTNPFSKPPVRYLGTRNDNC